MRAYDLEVTGSLKVHGDISAENYIIDNISAKPLELKKANIEFKKLSFAYDEKEKICSAVVPRLLNIGVTCHVVIFISLILPTSPSSTYSEFIVVLNNQSAHFFFLFFLFFFLPPSPASPPVPSASSFYSSMACSSSSA